jgi:regulator of PEP synthase PpsR (kinase-PPPase family)
VPQNKRTRGRPEGRALTIFVVSDATGETAERIVRAALAQFEDARAAVERRGRVRTQQRVKNVVGEAETAGALVIHTLVSNELRRTMLEEARLRNVDAMDIMGPLLDRLAARLRLSPLEKPGLFKQLAEAKTREIEAVEFALRHDDGQRSEELGGAEIVLVGVSRTMKTPTTLYLAYRGWFVANVPIVPALEPPAELLAMPPEQVFCLTMTEDRLIELRRSRAHSSGIPLDPYASLVKIREELLNAHALCGRRGWRIVDVTGKSVEEAAREIVFLCARGEPEKGPGW